MIPIEAILFDFGGVLLQHMDGIDHRAIEARFGLEERTLMRCLYRDSRYIDFQVGKCTFDEWIGSVRQALVNAVGEQTGRELMKAWEQAERPLNPQMIALVGRLRGAGYRTGIISNTIPGLEERLQQQAPHLVPLFDIRIGSGDLGIAKPDPQIYLHAARSLAVPPEHCVFTDDVAKYAEAARDVGMHGFHFQGYEGFVQDLRSVGVPA